MTDQPIPNTPDGDPTPAKPSRRASRARATTTGGGKGQSGSRSEPGDKAAGSEVLLRESGPARSSPETEVTRGDIVEISQGGAELVEARQLTVRQGGVGQAHADQITVRQGGIGRARAGEITISQGGAGLARADRIAVGFGGLGAGIAREVSVSQGVAGTLVANEAHLEQAGVRTLVARTVHAGSGTGVVFLIAQRVDGSVRTLFDWRSGLAFGAAFGVVVGLLRRRR